MHSVPDAAPAFDVEVFGSTDPGLQRTNNEDNFTICNLTTGECSLRPSVQQHRVGPQGTLFLVSDGMGGEQAGEVASEMCVRLVPRRLRELIGAAPQVDEAEFALALAEAIQYANTSIHKKAEATAHERGMGCTVTAAAVLGRRLLAAQVGDSRAYLIRGGEIKQLTEDQTLGNYLAALNPAAAKEISPSSHNILTQAVGSAATVKARITYVDLVSEDYLLVCSDGLYNMVTDAQICEVVTGTNTLLEKCKELIRRANARGGPDNITVIVARFRLPDQARPEPLPPIDCLEMYLKE